MRFQATGKDQYCYLDALVGFGCWRNLYVYQFDPLAREARYQSGSPTWLGNLWVACRYQILRVPSKSAEGAVVALRPQASTLAAGKLLQNPLLATTKDTARVALASGIATYPHPKSIHPRQPNLAAHLKAIQYDAAAPRYMT